MAYFHYRCGERITLINENTTAIRNDSEFDHGLVISAEPLMNDVLFEIIIDRKVNSWSGSLEIGVVDVDPLHFDFPPCASKIQSGSWIMSGTSIFKNGNCLIEGYGVDLDKLNQFDRIGLIKTSEGDLIFYINGESQGVAAEGLPPVLYAIVDLYGKCVQVSITSPTFKEHNNDDCLSGSSVLAIENDVLNVTLGGDLSELSLSSSNSLDIRMDMNVGVSVPDDGSRQDKIRFHDRCGSLVKLSNGNRTAERRRPLDEFNNGVVMTHRALRDSELFEIRIDRLVDKWSGSIEMGITTHNPNTLVFPATMTNMRSGTIMMSGCGILTNGKGTRREYGDFNLDELSEGDRVGMMRKPDGNLHYFINGLDQGVAAQRVPPTVWGVIDLYGMTIKVSIVERDEREEQNLMTRKNTRDQHCAPPDSQAALPDYYDRLTFHPNCGTHAEVINNGRTAHRPNASDDFNNGVVLTGRPLKTGEFFEVRLDKVVTKWAGSIEIGVTTHSPIDLEFPFTMTNVSTVEDMESNVQILNITEDIPQLQNVVQSQSESGYTSWSTNVSKRLISLYKSHQTQIGITIRKQKKLWEIIAEILNKEFCLNLTASQVENKWRTLLRAYKNVTDNNNKTGRGRKVFQYQEEMDLIFGKKKNINPEVLLSNETIVDIPKSINSLNQNHNEGKEHNLESPSSSRMELFSDTPTLSKLPMKNNDIEQKRCIRRKRLLCRNDVLEKIRLDRQKHHEEMEERTQLQRERLIERKGQNNIQEERNAILLQFLEKNIVTV